jgi:hypothetical protein
VKKLFVGPIVKDSTPKISRVIGAMIIRNPIATILSMNTLQNLDHKTDTGFSYKTE